MRNAFAKTTLDFLMPTSYYPACMDFRMASRRGRRAEGMESTPHVPRKLSGTVVDQFRVQCDTLARRELVSVFGFSEESLHSVSSLIDRVSEAVVAKITEGGWCNGTPLTRRVRNEIFIALGGSERVQEQVIAAILDTNCRPIGTSLQGFSTTISMAVTEEFVTDTSAHPLPLAELVRQRVAVAIADTETVPYKPYKAAAKHAKTDSDSSNPEDDVEDDSEDDAKNKPESIRKRLKTLSESPNAQMRRCGGLLRAHEIMEFSRTAKQAALDIVRSMLSSRFPPEMFNTTSLDDFGLSVTQMNDVAVNFLFWIMDVRRDLTKDHAVVVYLMMFKGMDAATVESTMKIYGQEDGVDYGFTEKRAESLYREAQRIITGGDVTWFDTYLKRCNPNDSSNRACIPNYGAVAARVRSLIAGTDVHGKSANSIASTYNRNIEIPSTEYDKTFDEIDVVLLQHGNLTARNRTLVRIMRMIAQHAYGDCGRYWAKRAGSIDESSDIFQGVAEIVMSKLVKFEPPRGRITTYMTWWIEQATTRYVMDNVLVRDPVHVHETASFIRNHPEMSNKEIADKRNASVKTIQLIRRSGLACRKIVWSDESIRNDDGDEDSVKGDFIKELQTGGEMQYEALQRSQVRDLLEAMMARLPPRDAYILYERMLNERTLEDIGIELGITRERVRQIEAKVWANMMALPADIVDPEETHDRHDDFLDTAEYFVLVDNKKRFARWLSVHFRDDTEKQVVKLWLGIDNPKKVPRKGCEKIIPLIRTEGDPRTMKAIKSAVQTTIYEARHLLMGDGADKAGLRIVSRADAYWQVRDLLKQIKREDSL